MIPVRIPITFSTIPIYGHKTFTSYPTFAQSIPSSCFRSLWTALFSKESNATISPGSSILHPTERTNPKWMNDEAQTNETKGTSRQGLFRFLASISSCISGSHSNTAQANHNRLVPAASESQQQLNGVVQRHLPFKIATGAAACARAIVQGILGIPASFFILPL